VDATDGGTVLADVKVQNTAGNPVLLRRDGQRAVGRFATRYAAFMPLRHTVHATTPNAAATAVATSHPTRHRVTETGPLRLWTRVENAHQQWTQWGQPGWDRLGFTVDTTTHIQSIWLDEPGNPIAILPR
jgi:hypothetical protein